jgi:hypothetical protein
VCEVETLTRAWRSVRRGSGSGVDGQTVRTFEARWAENMAELAAELRERRYHPLPYRQYLLPRPDGRQRPISLLALRDRIVQRAVLDVVRPVLEAAASPAAFGALPGRGVGDALARAEAARAAGNTWVVRCDIRAFFEEVEHERLLAAFGSAVRDRALTALVAEWLEVGLLGAQDAGSGTPMLPEGPTGKGGLGERLRDGMEAWRSVEDDLPQQYLLRPLAGALIGRTGERLLRSRLVRSRAALFVGAAGAVSLGAAAILSIRRSDGAVAGGRSRGTPQGSPLSPLLATSMLTPLDRALDRTNRVLVRYVDDMLLVCRDEGTAAEALAETRRQVSQLGLALNEEKTIVQPYDAGFTFLGTVLPQARSHGWAALGPRDALAEAFRGSGYWRARSLAPHLPRRGSGKERGR